MAMPMAMAAISWMAWLATIVLVVAYRKLPLRLVNDMDLVQR